MNLELITSLLRTRIGLDPDTLGPTAAKTVIAARMHALGLTDPTAYAARLASSFEEFETLVDEIVVPETWLFRGGELFTFLAKFARDALASMPARKRFRILSAPCSTGEEAYSLAIALTEEQVSSEQWTLEGIDRSRRNVQRAQRGRYGEFAFREEAAARRRPRFFHAIRGRWEIDTALRNAVRFQHGNLLDPFLFAGEGPFDLVLCRNLLIYLHTAAREQVLATLDRLLTPRGLLCTGHAEPFSLFERRFQAFGPAGHFLFQRRESKERTPTAVRIPVAPSARAQRQEPANTQSPRETKAAPKRDPLAVARQQADSGNLEAALATCRSCAPELGASADLYSLMGVIHHARHEPAEAIGCFRKALYLEPDHREALTHLMLLVQQDGQSSAAELLRRRLGKQVAGGEA